MEFWLIIKGNNLSFEKKLARESLLERADRLVLLFYLKAAEGTRNRRRDDAARNTRLDKPTISSRGGLVQRP